jgi:hypothetical protein
MSCSSLLSQVRIARAEGRTTSRVQILAVDFLQRSKRRAPGLRGLLVVASCHIDLHSILGGPDVASLDADHG